MRPWNPDCMRLAQVASSAGAAQGPPQDEQQRYTGAILYSLMPAETIRLPQYSITRRHTACQFRYVYRASPRRCLQAATGLVVTP